jgi:TRAP-type C4-dicarboxylate transport system substrate-binding protein
MRRRPTGCSVASVRRSVACLPALIVGLLLLAGCSGSSDKAGGVRPEKTKPTVLTVVNPLADTDQLKVFVAQVGRLSHGTLRIVIGNGWRAGQAAYASGTIRDVEAGKAELGVVAAPAWDAVSVGSLRALGAPLLIDSYALQDKVLRSPLIEQMLRGLQPLGLVGLGVLPGSLERPFGIARPLLRPVDYRRLRMGVQQSRVASATIRALGATPVWIASSGPVTGLGAVEVSEITTDFGQFLHGGYVTRNVVLWPRPAVVFAGRRAFARLTPAHRRVLEDALAASIAAETRLRVSYEAIQAELNCARPRLRYVTATPEDQSLLRAAVRPVYAELERNAPTRRFISEIEAVRARLAATADSIPSCRIASSFAAAATAPSPVDGAYSLAIRPSELPPSERVGEQYGAWQLVLDRGGFRLSEQSSNADWNADGSFRIAGHEMVWRVRDALDWGPHGAPNGVPLARGDTLRFGWHRRGAGLVLTAEDADPKLPALLVRSLTRVADAPGQQPLRNPSALQGTWAGTDTAADELAHGGDPGGIADNTGPLRLIVHGDRCRWEQRAPDGFHWGVGACRFAGDTLEIDITRTDEGASASPLFVHWSVFRGRLTFRTSPGFSPGNWAFHPWRKVG